MLLLVPMTIVFSFPSRHVGAVELKPTIRDDNRLTRSLEKFLSEANGSSAIQEDDHAKKTDVTRLPSSLKSVLGWKEFSNRIGLLAEEENSLFLGEKLFDEDHGSDVKLLVNFMKDVVEPVPVSNHGENRVLQASPVCGTTDDGALICAWESYPSTGLVTLFGGCTADVSNQVNVFQCTSCLIVAEDSIGDVDESDPQCVICNTCGGNGIEYDCSSVVASGSDCPGKDCAGNCIGGSPGPAPSPAESVCVTTDDGQIICAVDNDPADGFVSVFGGCTAIGDSVNPYQCDNCVILQEDSIEEIDSGDPRCSSCETCGTSIAYNCASFDASDPCLVKDCNGNCIAGPSQIDLSDVCTTPATGTISTFGSLPFLKPSFYQTCSESIVVQAERMQLHLASLRDIFKQYHCFHDIAKDPANSSPISFQPEFGNTVFDTDGGAVNLEEELNAIISQVEADGRASMATFWAIEKVFNRLYDGHVDVPDVEQNFFRYFLVAAPTRLLGSQEYEVDMDFSYGQDGKLQLTLLYSDGATTEELPVETINGLSVHDFVVSLARNPAVRVPYQTFGARMNALMQDGLVFRILPIAGNPLDVLPDTFEVTYVGGGSDLFAAGVVPFRAFGDFFSFENVNGETYYSFNRPFAEAFVNQPGEQFDAFQRGAAAIENAQAGRRNLLKKGDRSKTEMYELPRAPRRLQFVFDEETVPGVGAYSIQGDHAIMKLQTFSIQPLDLLKLWQKVAEAASDNGVTKLVIDLSSNGGGFVRSAYLLLMVMFPEADLTSFTEQWDINYNVPMREFTEVLTPVMQALEEELPNLSAADFQARLDTLAPLELEMFDIAIDALVEICQDADPTGDESEFQCQQISYLRQNATIFINTQSVDTYIDMMNSMLVTFRDHYTPWSVVLELVRLTGQPNIVNELIAAGIQSKVRGGVDSSLTAKFNLEGIEILQEIKDIAESLPKVFNEYVFVSDGRSASAGAIVPHTAVQLYKNRASTGVTSKVSLVGYGGSGVIDDMVLASIPANVQGVHLEDPILGSIALGWFIFLVPQTINNLAEIRTQADQYLASVVLPPFFGDTLPKMPVVNYYEKSMGPDALPLQFVRIPLDAYIQRVFTAVTFENSADLAALYEATALLDLSSTTSQGGPAGQPPSSGPAPTSGVPTPLTSACSFYPVAFFVAMVAFAGF